MVVPEKEGCGTGGRAGRDRIGAVGRPAESTTRVGERADGGPAATGRAGWLTPAQTWRANGGRW